VNRAIFRQVKELALAIAMVAAAPPPSGAAVVVSLPNACSDRNALRDIAIDARLTAIQFYYKAFVQSVGDRNKQRCLEAHVLLDDRFVVINKTRALIESKCLPIDVAARMATEGLCP
jgi:hypothetical protein